jgi:hypothetical protein
MVKEHESLFVSKEEPDYTWQDLIDRCRVRQAELEMRLKLLVKTMAIFYDEGPENKLESSRYWSLLDLIP